MRHPVGAVHESQASGDVPGRDANAPGRSTTRGLPASAGSGSCQLLAPAAAAAWRPSVLRGKGGLRVFVSNGVVRAPGAKDDNEKWTATAPMDIHLARPKNSNTSWVGLSPGKPRSLLSVL